VKHGTKTDRATSEYRSWLCMHMRCLYPSVNRYAQYGGRGIKVCERWKDFRNFLSDMGFKPSTEHSIDRINHDGNYEPENCRWATRSEQQSNTSRTVNLTFRGKTQCIRSWSHDLQIKPQTIWMRLFRGWTVDKALSTQTPKQETQIK